MKQLLFITAIISVIACNQNNSENKTQSSKASPALDSVHTAIEKAWADHVAADLKGDAITGASVFDDEGTMVEYGAPPVIGRTALDSAEVNNFKIFKVSELAHTIDGLSLQGDKAFQLGTVKGKFIMNADQSVMDVNSKYMASWKKQKDGSWRIHYFVYYP